MKDVRGFLDQLRVDPAYRGQIAHVRSYPARPPRFASLDPPLAQPLGEVLAHLGIEHLYTHQVAAIDAARRGEDIVVVTSTASGKTLSYNLPVLEEILTVPQARALYLFPTKALAQDQLKSLRRLADADLTLSQAARSGVYDGDTPQSARRTLRDQANLILTNPDMLHSGILPYHTRWARFFANLRTVVVDEIHTYRGVFGSHVANVLRRLNRVCDHYGSAPRYSCSSATIANPGEFAARLTGRPVTLVDDDGSPKGERWFVLWNPPLRDQAMMERASSNVEAERLMVHLIRSGVQTIAFGRARIVAELLYRYVSDQLRLDASRLAAAVRPYRGGYLPAERREIERLLFSGQLMGVTSTNALELGIDIGGLDAAIIVGFPGTVASTWQQAGRAGRGTTPALVFFIAYNEPVDQFIIRRPEYILDRSPESAIIDPENPYILASQLGCAAAELPLRAEDRRYFGERVADVAAALAEEGLLKALGPAFYWAQGHQPSHRVGLRIASDSTVTILDTTGENRVLAQVDRISAPELVYPEAVYLHEGQTYVVERLDLEQKIASVRREDVDYYTQAILESVIQIDREEQRREWGFASLRYGEVTVTWATVAFKKIQFYSTDSLGWGAVDLPSQRLKTMGTWLVTGADLLREMRGRGLNPVEALVGIRNAAVHMLPLLAMCDKMDIGGMVDSANLGTPALFLYDRYPGGVGFAECGFHRVRTLLESCLRLIEECDCRAGCPSCVGLPTLRPPIHTDPDAGGGYPIPNKEAALYLLPRLIAGAPSPLPASHPT
jgi:DEAD/DEAH box helicase domain-containing protein